MTAKILTSAFILATCCHSISSETQQKTLESLGRKRRGYAYTLPKEISTDPSSAFSMWKPWSYTLSRPYYIPVYGVEGQPPIYFPPQPFFLNPGTPPDNPIKRKHPFKGPQYLPPKKNKPDTDMKIGTRFQTDDEDEDVRPVWGTNPPEQPTRRPRPGKVNTVPLSVDDNEVQPARKPVRPRPSIQRTTTTTTTTVRPTSTSRPGPSNCVWAVVSCCSVTSNAVPESCFEQRGCPGPFWGASPCDSDFAKAAIDAALKYYGGS